jgi:hypothetical protein
MKQLNPSNFPCIPGVERGHAVHSVNINDLREIKTNHRPKLVMIDDVWSFPNMDELETNKGIVVRQELFPGSRKMRTMILGERTRRCVTEYAWFDISYLTRTNCDGNPIFPEWCDLGSEYNIICRLAGHTFHVTSEIVYYAPVFECGRKTDRGEMRQIPAFPYEPCK